MKKQMRLSQQYYNCFLSGTHSYIGLEDDEETSEVPDAPFSPQSSTTIYCFLSETHSYIDGTKDWKTMKKRLRFQMPQVPPQSSTIIYCFLSGTHTYIDGTKDWKTMKKRLRL